MTIEASGRGTEDEESQDGAGISAPRDDGNPNEGRSQLADIHEDDEEKIEEDHAVRKNEESVQDTACGAATASEPISVDADIPQKGTKVELVRMLSAKKKEIDIARTGSSSTMATQSAADPEETPHKKPSFLDKMFRSKQSSSRPPDNLRNANHKKGWLQGSFRGSFQAASSGGGKKQTMTSRFTNFMTGNFSEGQSSRFAMRRFFGKKQEADEEDAEGIPAEVQTIMDKILLLKKRFSGGEEAALLFHDVQDCVFALEALRSSAMCPEALELKSRVVDTIQSDADILATQALLVNGNRFEENIVLAEKAIEKFALLELPDEENRCKEIIEVCKTRIEIRDILVTADAQLSAKEYKQAHIELQRVMDLLPDSLQPSLQPSVVAKLETCVRARKRARQLAIKGYRRAQTLQASTSRYQWEHAHGLLELAWTLFQKSGDLEAAAQCQAMQANLAERLKSKSLEASAGHEKAHELEAALKEIDRLKSWLEHCKTESTEMVEMVKAEERLRRVRGTKLLEILAFLTEQGLEQLIIGFVEAEAMLEQAESDLVFASGETCSCPERPLLDSMREKLTALQAASNLWNHCRSLNSDLDFEEKISGMRRAKEMMSGFGSTELQVQCADEIAELNESRQWHSSLVQKKLDADVSMVAARDEVLRMKSILSSTQNSIQSKAVRSLYAQEYAKVRDSLLPTVANLQDRGVEKYLEAAQATLDDIDHRYAHWLIHQRKLRRQAREMELARRVREAERLDLTLPPSDISDMLAVESSDEEDPKESGAAANRAIQKLPAQRGEADDRADDIPGKQVASEIAGGEKYSSEMVGGEKSASASEVAVGEKQSVSAIVGSGVQLLDGKRKLQYARLEEENLGFAEAEQLYVEALSFLKGTDEVLVAEAEDRLAKLREKLPATNALLDATLSSVSAIWHQRAELLSKENRRRLETTVRQTAGDVRVDSSRAGHEQWREALQTPPTSAGVRAQPDQRPDSQQPQTDSRQLASGRASTGRVDAKTRSESQAASNPEADTAPPPPNAAVVHSERDMARYGGRMVFRPSFHSDPSDIRYDGGTHRLDLLPFHDRLWRYGKGQALSSVGRMAALQFEDSLSPLPLAPKVRLFGGPARHDGKQSGQGGVQARAPQSLRGPEWRVQPCGPALKVG